MKEILPKRKNIRLKYYDYSQKGMYFITICIKNRLELLGKIKNINYIQLTKEGFLAEKYIKNIEQIYKNVTIDEYIIMPNHIHCILIINSKKDISISRIIKQYKMYVSKKIGYSIWQKSFHEHIIKNKQEYFIIKKYIQNNIINWKNDIFFCRGG